MTAGCHTVGDLIYCPGLIVFEGSWGHGGAIWVMVVDVPELGITRLCNGPDGRTHYTEGR